MDLSTFEEKWSRRHELSDLERNEIEKLADANHDCRDFSKGGDWVRRLCSDLEAEKAPDSFAYKMKVYANNHLDEDEALKERSSRFPMFGALALADRTWVRWTAMVSGLATGAVAMMLFFTPVQPTIAPAGVITAGPAGLSGSENMNLAKADSAVTTSDTLSRSKGETPEWDLRTVGTNE